MNGSRASRLPLRLAATRGRRTLPATVAVLALGASTLLLPGAAATDGDDPAAEDAAVVVHEKGTMDADEVTLSGGATPDAAPAGAPQGRGAAPDGPVPAGWSTQLDLRAGTQMVALSWDGDASGPEGPDSARLALRSRSAGTWSDWLPIEPDPDDHGGEGAGRVGSEVIWLGSEGAEAVEVRVDAGPVAGLELLRMRYHEGEPVEVAAAPAGDPEGRSAAQPAIRARSTWASGGWRSGNSGCGSGPNVAGSLVHAVVHHTASTNTYTAAQVPGLIDAIYRYHTGSLGWCDIAYNFVVDKFGVIWQGRSGDITRPVVGGHAMGFNTGSVGVTLLGQFEPGASPASASPTAAMIDSTARVLAWKLGLHGLNPTGSVTVTSGGSTRYSSGTRVTIPVINTHQQTSTTACPGANVISRMGEIRLLAASYMGGGGGTPNPPPNPPPGGDPNPARWAPFPDAQTLTYRQFVDFLRHPGSYEQRLWWNTNLVSGGTTRNALVAALLDSHELQTFTAAPVRLYLAYFDRAPDQAGLRYWWGRLDNGTSLRKTSAHFADSSEFRSRYGSLSNADFVRLVYQNVLRRAPDTSGFQFWTGRLNSGAENRGGVMAHFSESSEFRGKTKALTDAVVTHESMLRRSLTTAQMRTWEPLLQGNRSSMVDLIFATADYRARFGY